MKTALITGSTKGIGKQIGIDLLDKGYQVYFIGRTHESIDRLKGELGCYLNAHIIMRDLSTIESNVRLGEELKLQKIMFDVVVLNLGITDRTPFGEIIDSSWNVVIETNLSGPIFLLQTLKDNLNKNGKIVFISSISGIIADSVSISYGVSKAAINMAVPYLAKEFAVKKITVNAIAPGYVDTDWHKNKDEAQIKRISKKCLANRLGTVKEISTAVLSVIDNNFINGQVIRVDGGFQL